MWVIIEWYLGNCNLSEVIFVYHILFNVFRKCFYMGYVFEIDGKVIP